MKKPSKNAIYLMISLFPLFPSSFPTRKKPSKSCNHLKYKPFTVPRNGIPHQNIDLRLSFLIDKKPFLLSLKMTIISFLQLYHFYDQFSNLAFFEMCITESGVQYYLLLAFSYVECYVFPASIHIV